MCTVSLQACLTWPSSLFPQQYTAHTSAPTSEAKRHIDKARVNGKGTRLLTLLVQCQAAFMICAY